MRLLVVIGTGWLDSLERLHNSEDFVRIEIEAALNRADIPVVPVLLDGATIPSAEDLPESLQALVRRNAITVPHAQFAQIVDGRLTSALQQVLVARSKSDDAPPSRLLAHGMRAPKV